MDSFRNMFKNSGSWFVGSDNDPHSVVFVIRDRIIAEDGEHVFASEADALNASMKVFVDLLELYDVNNTVRERLDQWVNTRIRKIVKRAHGKRWRKALSYCHQDGAIPSVVYDNDQIGVICFAPMRLSEQPNSIKQLQVSGLDLEYITNECSLMPNTLNVILDQSLNLSTGKAIAQAGHAVQLAFKYLGDLEFQSWSMNGFQISVRRGNINEQMFYPVVVRDAGFTEVTPGSVTAVAYLAD